jgi:hypothetical protein
MQLGTYVVIWACLAMIVLALALVRYLFSLHEDDNMHISIAQKGMIPQQLAVFTWLDAIDRWGKVLTVVAFVGGLALAALYLVRVFYARTMPG